MGAAFLLACGDDEPPEKVESPCAKSVDGVELCFRSVGAAQAPSPVVILAGGPGWDSWYLHDLADTLSEIEPDLRVVTFDARGTGATAASDGSGFQLAQQAQDVDALRGKLGADKIHLVAHGWSGLVAYEYLRAFSPHVRSLTLMGAFAPGKASNDQALVELDKWIESLQGQGIIPVEIPVEQGNDCSPPLRAKLPAYVHEFLGTVPDELHQIACSTLARNGSEAAAGAYDYVAEALAFPGPMLVISGKSDAHSKGVTLDNVIASAFATAAPAPISVPAVGHFPWHESTNGDFERAIADFLAAHP